MNCDFRFITLNILWLTNTTGRKHSFSSLWEFLFLFVHKFQFSYSFLFLDSALSFKKLFKLPFITFDWSFHLFLDNHWLFTIIFATGNAVSHVFDFEFLLLFHFIIVIGFWQYFFETLEIFWIIFKCLQKLITLFLGFHVDLAFVSFLYNWIGENFIHCRPFLGFNFKEWWNGCGQFIWIAQRYSLKNPCAYFSVKTLKISCSEGWPKSTHFIKNAAKRPYITFYSVRFIFPDLRTSVVRSAGLSTGKLFFKNFGNIQIA